MAGVISGKQRAFAFQDPRELHFLVLVQIRIKVLLNFFFNND
jgi:hypothetical protein